MIIPEPDKFAKEAGYQPFPPRWEKWLSAVRASLLASQPVAGRNVTTDEHPGKGTVINVDDSSSRRRKPPTPTATGACCVGEVCSITTEAECATAGGTWQGVDTPCEPNPCVAAPVCTITGPVCIDPKRDSGGGTGTTPGAAWTNSFPEQDDSLGCIYAPLVPAFAQVKRVTSTQYTANWRHNDVYVSLDDTPTGAGCFTYSVDRYLDDVFDSTLFSGTLFFSGIGDVQTIPIAALSQPPNPAAVDGATSTYETRIRIVGVSCGYTYTMSFEVTGFNPTCSAGPSSLTVPSDGCGDPLNIFHYLNNTGGIDTGTAFFSMFLTKNNGDAPTGHFALMVQIACTGMGSWQPNSCGATFTDLGTDPRGTYVFDADGDDATCGVTGVHYHAVLTISG